MRIILDGPNGKRVVEAGLPYKLQPGEKIVGSERSNEMQEEHNKLKRLAKEQGIGVGDLVAKLTKVFGIKPCASCEQRRQILNRLRIDGWKITLDKVE